MIFTFTLNWYLASTMPYCNMLTTTLNYSMLKYVFYIKYSYFSVITMASPMDWRLSLWCKSRGVGLTVWHTWLAVYGLKEATVMEAQYLLQSSLVPSSCTKLYKNLCPERLWSAGRR